MGSGVDLPRFDSLTVGDNTPTERRKAAVAVADRARDAAECRELLVVLGLVVMAEFVSMGCRVIGLGVGVSGVGMRMRSGIVVSVRRRRV